MNEQKEINSGARVSRSSLLFLSLYKNKLRGMNAFGKAQNPESSKDQLELGWLSLSLSLSCVK